MYIYTGPTSWPSSASCRRRRGGRGEGQSGRGGERVIYIHIDTE